MKNELLQHCQNYCLARLERIQGEIDKINLSLTSETKSSAGDKHETGRAMLQLEREKLGAQLLEAEKMKKVLDKVTAMNQKERIALGSLVQTDSVNYYIAISAGRVRYQEDDVFCISPSTPIGRLLIGKTVGETIQFNGNEQRITKVE